jgi:hypothetical protein
MKFYNLFIPNKKNKFHPPALRSTGLVIFSILFVIIPTLYNAVTAHRFKVLGYSINITVSDLHNLSNQERINVGLSALSLNSQLNNAAYAKAQHMFANNYWAHVAPDGTTPWSFIANSGYSYISAGENLAKNFNYSNGVVAGWMASEGHRANILHTSYQDVGYAVLNGTLLGEETTLVVAMYGQRYQQTVATTTEPIVASPEPEYVAPPAVEPAQTTYTTQNTYIEPTQNKPVTDINETQELTVEETDETASVIELEEETDEIVAQLFNDGGSTPEKSGFVAGVKSILSRMSYQSLNWGQKTSLLLASTLILLFIMKHTLVWRAHKRGVKNVWLRAHPLGQIAVLAIAIFTTLFNSIGVIL